MFGFGVGELVVILMLVVLFFGARRIPEIARGLGEGIRNFKSGVKEPDELPEGDQERDREESHDGS